MDIFKTQTIRFETPRLLIRPHETADFEEYYAYINDPELCRMLGLQNVSDRAGALENFNWCMENVTFLALAEKETGTVIGHICVHPALESLRNDPAFCEKRGCSLSFAISKARRRRGLMEEALRGLIGDLFRNEGIEYIDCENTPENTASQTLQEKLGFSYWGDMQLGDTQLLIHILKNDTRKRP